MPQFRFARSRPRAGETEEAYEVREEREEGEAREAVMTFILGLVAEPIPLKYVNTPGPDRLAEMQGRKVLDKYNCIGCHQVRPGVYDVKPTKETLDALEKAYQNYEKTRQRRTTSSPATTPGPACGSPWPDRLMVYGTQAHVANDKDADRDMLQLRLTEAMHFTNNDQVVRDVPAGMTAMLPPEDVIDQSPPFGGALAEPAAAVPERVNSTSASRTRRGRCCRRRSSARASGCSRNGCTSSCSTRGRCARRRT